MTDKISWEEVQHNDEMLYNKIVSFSENESETHNDYVVVNIHSWISYGCDMTITLFHTEDKKGLYSLEYNYNKGFFSWRFKEKGKNRGENDDFFFGKGCISSGSQGFNEKINEKLKSYYKKRIENRKLPMIVNFGWCFPNPTYITYEVSSFDQDLNTRKIDCTNPQKIGDTSVIQIVQKFHKYRNRFGSVSITKHLDTEYLDTSKLWFPLKDNYIEEEISKTYIMDENNECIGGWSLFDENHANSRGYSNSIVWDYAHQSKINREGYINKYTGKQNNYISKGYYKDK